MKPNEIKMGRFVFYPHYEDFIIESEEGSLEVAPAESGKLISMLVAVNGMQNFRVLPSLVQEPPFVIKITDTGNCFLSRDFEEKGVAFPIYNVEELVEGIKEITRKIQDLRALRGGPDAGSPAWTIPDPPVEGR